ncbi:MAG TPA: TSUP family transporter [Xanthobacteraceae bacterium]|jgi:uncharacterized membrane protein YfcA|nr:TSUP family transporter [Xanthobacteraceae bacterium]
MSYADLAIIGATIFASSFFAGIFGLAGGMLLLGALLVYLDVVTAMLVFSLIQLSSNGWRILLWRRYVRLPIFYGYLAGGIVAFLAMRLVSYVPDKPTVYLTLGLVPWVVELIPRNHRPHIERRFVPVLSGLVTTTLHLIAGSGGLFLDVFFQKSKLDRRTTVATKSLCQSAGHVFRLMYFGSVGGLAASLDGSHGFPLWAYIPAIAFAIAGTSLAPLILDRMTDDGFRTWTRRIIFFVSFTYLARAAWLYWQVWHGGAA